MGYYSFAELIDMGISVPSGKLENPENKVFISDEILERLKSGNVNWVEYNNTEQNSTSPQVDNEALKTEVQQAIEELKSLGITDNTQEHEVVGLGDVVEGVLNKFGITEERFKSWFNLKECGCKERKKFLNGVFSWHRKKKESE